jgi:pimeloyl-ACP methyl ester carboxylesterase
MRSLFLSIVIIFFTDLLSAQQPTLTSDDLYPYEGTFDFGKDRRITLGIFDEFKSLVYLDLKTLKLGALIPFEKNAFRDNNDSTKLFIFLRDKKNNVAGLKIIENTISKVGKRIVPHSMQPVSFVSGKRTLKGDLYIPASKTPYPAVVFAHGSGAATRSVAFFTTYFLQLGIAVLTFDKQGAGESEGDWETADFDELADDVIAGIDFLKKQNNINPKKIGIMGNSQGGWIGSMAAAKSTDVAFLLMRVGAVENVMETMLHENRGTYLADGYKVKDVDEILQMERSFMNAAIKGKTWEQGDSVIQSYRNKLWFKKLYPKPRVKSVQSEKGWQWLQINLLYDSYDYLKKIKVPVFWMMAEKDWNVNSQRSYPRIMKALEIAGNKDYSVKIIPNSGHRGLIAKTGYYNEAISWQYAPGFWDIMQTWLTKRKIAK